jgi:hypothetical protein
LPLKSILDDAEPHLLGLIRHWIVVLHSYQGPSVAQMHSSCGTGHLDDGPQVDDEQAQMPTLCDQGLGMEQGKLGQRPTAFSAKL